MDAARHVATLVREADPDGYIAALYAAEPARRGLLSLRAFNSDVAAIRHRIREPLAGEMRIQWWRDALAQPAGTRTGNPVADELRDTIARHALPVAAFDRLLEARIFDLYDDPMPDRATLEGYLGETRSSLVQLAVVVLDPAAAAAAADAAGHAGCLTGIVEGLAGLARGDASVTTIIPDDLFAAVGATRETVREYGAAARVGAALAAMGEEHLTALRRGLGALPSGVRPAFIHAAIAAVRLRHMRRRAGLVPADISTLRCHFAALGFMMRGRV